MAIGINIFYLYKLANGKGLLLRVGRPGYSNANQNQQNLAEEVVGMKRRLLLERYLETQDEVVAAFLGEFQGLPDGDALYKKNGALNLKNLCYAKTRWGENWIYLTLAEDLDAFAKITEEADFADNGLKKTDLKLPPTQLALTDFVTDFDFDLSSIPDAYTLDLEDKRRGK